MIQSIRNSDTTRCVVLGMFAPQFKKNNNDLDLQVFTMQQNSEFAIISFL